MGKDLDKVTPFSNPFISLGIMFYYNGRLYEG